MGGWGGGRCTAYFLESTIHVQEMRLARFYPPSQAPPFVPILPPPLSPSLASAPLLPHPLPLSSLLRFPCPSLPPSLRRAAFDGRLGRRRELHLCRRARRPSAEYRRYRVLAVRGECLGDSARPPPVVCCRGGWVGLTFD